MPQFQAVITPRRSLSLPAMRVLLAAICALCIGSASLWVIVGAWPVGGFTGLELLLAAWLVRMHIRAGRASELVLLTDSSLRIIRTNPAGQDGPGGDGEEGFGLRDADEGDGEHDWAAEQEGSAAEAVRSGAGEHRRDAPRDGGHGDEVGDMGDLGREVARHVDQEGRASCPRR
jgi:hypothetical protein